MNASTLAWCALAIALLMLGMWLLSLPLSNASIVDIIWGPGFVLTGWVARFTTDGDPLRSNLMLAAVTLWGLRLGAYLWWRNHGKGEDFRYVNMRRAAGPSFWWRSLYIVFGLQGVLMFVVATPLMFGMADSRRGWTPLIVLGVLLWAVGMVFETVGDAQLAAFKRRPDSAGKVMDRGLWRYTRHPNYFGDFCVWWGIFAMAAATPRGWWGLLGPLVMSTLLLRVSGVTLLERSLTKRRPGYAEYVARTSAFFPRPPRQADR